MKKIKLLIGMFVAVMLMSICMIVSAETYPTSKLFSTSSGNTLLTKSGLISDQGLPLVSAVHFVDMTNLDISGYTTIDYSADGNGSVLGWLDGAELYIGGYGEIVASESLACAFENGLHIEKITGLDILCTSKVTDMRAMFSGCGIASSGFAIDLGDRFDTSNVTDMSYMFSDCGEQAITGSVIDLGDNFDTSNVTDMNHMFYNCRAQSLDLGNKFDTSSVTDMSYMFAVYNSDQGQNFTLDLGDKFDTSNVTDMSYMFNNCGKRSKNFTLDLEDKFDTSNVTNMAGMFGYCGYNSSSFILDLGDKFDTSNVTNMSEMFAYCGSSNPTFTLDLGDKFDTSNVTDMGYMFVYCGYNSLRFAIDLGDSFDTSNVMSMKAMFGGCGSNSTNFTLDLGNKFNTSNVTDMSYMFAYCGCGKTLELSGFTVGEKTDLTDFAPNMNNVTTFIFGDGWTNATIPTGFASVSVSTPTTVIDASANLKNYNWGNDNRTATFIESPITTIWKTDTDSGYYKNYGQNHGLIRFLFDVEFSKDMTGLTAQSGIKYIRAADLAEKVENSTFAGGSETGTSNTFYGDVTGITEDKKGNTYYAVGYITIGGKTYWSAPVPCQPSFDRLIKY